MKTLTQWIEEQARDLTVAELISNHENEFVVLWEKFFAETANKVRKAGEKSIENLLNLVDNPSVYFSTEDFDLLWAEEKEYKDKVA